jgi:undecaprenyl pyrophosphate phosphatase UppP
MQISGEVLYGVNELVIALVVIGLLLLIIEVGYRLGNRVPPGLTDSAKSPVLAISGAIFGLLALLLGFTFSMSLSRFDLRKQLVVQEANGIGTTYLRAGLLPEPDRSAVAGLLRSYVEARLDFYNLRDDQAQFKNVIDRTVKMQDELWSHAADVVQKGDRSATTALFVQSLNEVIDLHAERVAAMENHVPESVLLLLLLVAMLAAMLVGYGCGLAQRRHFFSTSIVAFLIGMVILVIIDLDRPNHGLIRVSQKSMIRLHDSIKNGAP